MAKIVEGLAQAKLKARLSTRDRTRRGTLHSEAQGQAKQHRPARNDLLPQLELKTRLITELKSAEHRLRKADEGHILSVIASIRELGVCRPIIVDAADFIIDGHIVVEAARRAGLTEIPCVVVRHLDGAQLKLLSITLNKLGEQGEWDFDALRPVLRELFYDEQPIEIAGFSVAEVDQIVFGDDRAETAPLEPEADAAPVTRRGDQWLLGSHVLRCGDATDAEDLERLLCGTAVRLVLTDVPYNVPVRGHVTRGRHREFVQGSGEMSREEFSSFLLASLGHAKAHVADGGLVATFIDWRGVDLVLAAGRELELDLLNIIVWTKTNAGMGSLYRSQHELLPLFKVGSEPHTNNVKLGRHGRWRSNVWSYPGASSLGSDARRGLKVHPSVKPVALLKDALLDVTEPRDAVLDPFLGSGSTLMAADEAGRRCFGMDLDPLYVDVAIRRWETATGQQAVLSASDETFAEVAARRVGETEEPAGTPARRSRKDQQLSEEVR